MQEQLSALPFSLEAFCTRAALGLHHAPPQDAAQGDHLLTQGVLPSGPPSPAAVLVPIVPRGGVVNVILTLRSANLKRHPGQISFPGGRIDPSDADVQSAALREANEEIGLDPKHVRSLGYLDTYLSHSGFRVFPLVGLVDPAADFMVDPGEVAEMFEVPLEFLMSPARHEIGERAWRGTNRRVYVMTYGDRSIWGITAGILRNMYDRLYAP